MESFIMFQVKVKNEKLFKGIQKMAEINNFNHVTK